MRIASQETIRDRTPFIGRARERALLIDCIGRGTGLLMLTGPSGIGKTRLARQVGGEVAAFIPGGARFCSLAGCQSAADLEAVVARTLGIPQRQGQDLARAIAGRGPILLILDNVDSVAALVGDVIGTWLDHCSELQMIATSIVPIGVEGEVRLEVGPLEAEDAVALYLERANRAWAGRVFSATEEPAVEELVVRLDRSPLAIELAAARIRVLSPQTMLSKIGQRFELLRSSSPGRHGSLIEALTLTWELLSDREKAILSRASAFEGGFTYEAAVEVLVGDAGEVETLDLLDGLRSKALLQIGDAEPPRFQLFESVKEYGYRELHRSGFLEESLRKHAEFFLAHGEHHAARIEGAGGRESIRWLKAERENLYAVHVRNLETDPALATRAGLALAPVLLLEGHPPSESQLAETTLDAARRSEDPKLIIQALDTRFNMLRQHGRVEDALVDSEEALALARSIGDRRAEGHFLVQAATLHVRRGELAPAIPLLELAVRLSREEGEPLIEGMALMIQGEVELGRQALDEAGDLFHRSLQLFRKHGLLRSEGLALTRVGLVRNSQGRFREARKALQDALAVSRQMENRSFEASTLSNLGNVDLAAGLLDQSEAYSEQALSLYREVGNRIGEGIALGNLGILALERAESNLAEKRFVESEGILVEAGVKGLHAELLCFIAVMEARHRRLDEARRSLREARAYFASVDDQASLSRTEIIEGIFEVSEARKLAPKDAEASSLLIERARSRLHSASSQKSGKTGNLSTILRLLEQDLLLWTAELRESGVHAPATGLRVAPDAEWFELAGSPRVNLRRRVAIRRIFEALVEKRFVSPGIATDPHDLFDLGWPGVQAHPELAMKRVYFAVWALREMGLAEILLHQTDGYLLDPKLPLLRDGG